MSHPRFRRLFRIRKMAAPLATAIGIVVVAMAASRADAADFNGKAALTSGKGEHRRIDC